MIYIPTSNTKEIIDTLFDLPESAGEKIRWNVICFAYFVKKNGLHDYLQDAIDFGSEIPDDIDLHQLADCIADHWENILLESFPLESLEDYNNESFWTPKTEEISGYRCDIFTADFWKLVLLEKDGKGGSFILSNIIHQADFSDDATEEEKQEMQEIIKKRLSNFEKVEVKTK